MKKKYIFLLIGLLCFSCKTDLVELQVKADFEYSPQVDIKVGDTIHFSNLSENATGFNWSFGDSNNSIDKDAKHIYKAGGTYKVELQSYNSIYADTIIKYINVREATKSELLFSHIWTAFLVETCYWDTQYGDGCGTDKLPSSYCKYIEYDFKINGTLTTTSDYYTAGISTKNYLWSISGSKLILENTASVEKLNLSISKLTIDNLILELQEITGPHTSTWNRVSFKPK